MREVQERRSIFRVRMTGAMLEVEVDGLRGCGLVDANSEGLAVIARATLFPEQEVTIVVHHDGRSFCGSATVRNVRPLEGGKTRYGLQVAATADELRRGLRALSIEAQRRQLRRAASRRET